MFAMHRFEIHQFVAFFSNVPHAVRQYRIAIRYFCLMFATQYVIETQKRTELHFGTYYFFNNVRHIVRHWDIKKVPNCISVLFSNVRHTVRHWVSIGTFVQCSPHSTVIVTTSLYLTKQIARKCVQYCTFRVGHIIFWKMQWYCSPVW